MKADTRIVIALAFVLAGARSGVAQDVVAGWEGDPIAGYVFVAPTAVFGMTPSQSVLLRTTASLLYYNSEASGPTDVIAPGAGLAVGYRLQNRRLHAAVFGGYEQRQVRHIWERGGSASGELFVNVTQSTQVAALGNFAEANRYTWARVSAKQQLTNTDYSGPRAFSIGVEATGQGNREVTRYQLGLVLEHAWLRAGTSLQFRAGYSTATFRSGPDEEKPYFGIGMYRRF